MILKNIITYIVLITMLSIGIWVKGFPGGAITGAAITMLLMATIGKVVATKSINRVDKQLKDILVNKASA